jgi:hypothetical protein
MATSFEGTRAGRSPARARTWQLASVMLLLCAEPLGAQVIQGRVVDAETGRAIAGALLLLSDGEGHPLQSVLSSETGAFQLEMPRSGAYLLRAEMIGRQSVEIGPFPAASAGASHRLELPSLPILLTGLEVTGAERCSGDLESARSVYAVWVEIEKALRATRATLASTRHRFRVAEYERKRRKGSMEIVEESATETTVTGGRKPFSSLAPARLERDGYFQDENGVLWIYGPSTELLLSREFRATHCFRLRRDDDRPEAIGLEFRPVDGRDVSDIRGVLWVDAASAELRTLEFEFEDVPRELMRGDYVGEAEFRRLNAGGWIISRWWLRSPDPENLLQIRERAGEVLDVDRAPQ